MLLVVLVAITWAGRSLLQIKTESGMLPRNVHDESEFATVAVNGVPIVPTISYEASRGPLGVLPTGHRKIQTGCCKPEVRARSRCSARPCPRFSRDIASFGLPTASRQRPSITGLQMPGHEPSGFVQLVGHLAEGVGVAVGPEGVPLGVADSLYSGAGGYNDGHGRAVKRGRGRR